MRNPELMTAAGPFVGPTAGAPVLASLRGARPGQLTGMNRKPTPNGIQLGSGLMRWRRAARFRRTLVVVKRKPRGHSAGPSCL